MAPGEDEHVRNTSESARKRVATTRKVEAETHAQCTNVQPASSATSALYNRHNKALEDAGTRAISSHNSPEIAHSADPCAIRQRPRRPKATQDSKAQVRSDRLPHQRPVQPPALTDNRLRNVESRIFQTIATKQLSPISHSPAAASQGKVAQGSRALEGMRPLCA